MYSESASASCSSSSPALKVRKKVQNYGVMLYVVSHLLMILDRCLKLTVPVTRDPCPS